METFSKMLIIQPKAAESGIGASALSRAIYYIALYIPITGLMISIKWTSLTIPLGEMNVIYESIYSLIIIT